MHQTLHNVECEVTYYWSWADQQNFARKQRELRRQRQLARILVLFVAVCLLVACTVTALALRMVMQGGGR